jgi:hypothetical protein
MKLRILGDSLRLRLSQSEVDQLGKDGRVEDGIRFGPQGARLMYALVADDAAAAPSASFDASRIVVSVPTGAVRTWVDSDQVGMSAQQGNLHILIEKDFKCLTPRPGEEQYDGFPNPNQSC